MRAIARAAMRTPEVGVTMFVNPSPNWKASTIAWRETPTISAKGAMMGMVMAALAVALGIRKLMRAWMPYIADSDATGPVPSSPSCIPWRRLSTTCPSCRMTMIPEAKPTTRAAERMSLAPARNSSAIRLAPKPAMTPHTIPIPRKSAVISGRYHSQTVTPTMRAMTVRSRTTRIQPWRVVSGVSSSRTASAGAFRVLWA